MDSLRIHKEKVSLLLSTLRFGVNNPLMSRKPLKLLSILFFSISVLARGITGAPNAQVEVFNADFLHHSIVTQDSTSKLHFGQPATSLLQPKSYFVGEDNHSHIKSYKKYVSPDRASSFNLTTEPRAQSGEVSRFQDIWIFSSLPTVVHTNAPPMNTGLTSFIGIPSLKGASNVEGQNSSYSGWRVSLLQSRINT